MADKQNQAVLFFTSHLVKSLCQDQVECITRMENTDAEGCTRRTGRAGVSGKGTGKAAKYNAVEVIIEEESDVYEMIVDKEKQIGDAGILLESQPSKRAAAAKSAQRSRVSTVSSSAAAAVTTTTNSAAAAVGSVADEPECIAITRPRRGIANKSYFEGMDGIDDDIASNDNEYVEDMDDDDVPVTLKSKRKVRGKPSKGNNSNVSEIIDGVHGWIICIRQISVMRPRYCDSAHQIMFLVGDAVCVGVQQYTETVNEL